MPSSKTTPQVLTFHYVLKDADGRLIESTLDDDPMCFLEGAQEIMPSLEVKLIQMKVGEEKRIALSAAEAYGQRNEDFVILVPKENLPPDVKVGELFETDDDHEFPVMRVLSIDGDAVKMDGNHPLAGVSLVFEVKMVDTRPATADEISHGHAHDPKHSHLH